MNALVKEVFDLLEFIDKQEIVDQIESAMVRHRLVEKLRCIATRVQELMNESNASGT